ncbi:hypothetical protein PINS_up015853 [Pythium insidiosum]|nr:hypothetical protein PINS_up015853 [Pythium insidiosum]
MELETVEALHAFDVLAATGHVLLRTALDIEAPLAQVADKIKAWEDQLVSIEQHAARICFRFPEKPESLLDCRGVDVTARATSISLPDLVRVGGAT